MQTGREAGEGKQVWNEAKVKQLQEEYSQAKEKLINRLQGRREQLHITPPSTNRSFFQSLKRGINYDKVKRYDAMTFFLDIVNKIPPLDVKSTDSFVSSLGEIRVLFDTKKLEIEKNINILKKHDRSVLIGLSIFFGLLFALSGVGLYFIGPVALGGGGVLVSEATKILVAITTVLSCGGFGGSVGSLMGRIVYRSNEYKDVRDDWAELEHLVNQKLPKFKEDLIGLDKMDTRHPLNLNGPGK